MVVIAAVSRHEPRRRVVEEAATLAAALGEEVHVVNVLELSEFVELETSAVRRSGKPEEMEAVRRRAAEFASDAAEGVTEAFTPVGIVGDPASEVVEYARDEDASYIVVGGRKRSPTGKAVFGSVTQSILLAADCPVVTILRRD